MTPVCALFLWPQFAPRIPGPNRAFRNSGWARSVCIGPCCWAGPCTSNGPHLQRRRAAGGGQRAVRVGRTTVAKLWPMSDALWWLPSVLVFGLAAVGVTAGVVALRRSAQRRAVETTSALRELQSAAGSALVAADNEVQAAEDEVAFARAEFGDESVADYREAVTTARRRLREAFLLQQRLDDSEPDSDAQCRSWNTQIAALCQSAHNALDGQARAFSKRRAAERGAPAELTALQSSVAALERRAVASEELIAKLAPRYADTALQVMRAALGGARAELSAATAAADEVAVLLERGQAAAPMLAESHARQRTAARQLDAVDSAAARIRSAETAATDAARQLRSDIEEARGVRDAHEDPKVASRVNAAIESATRVLAALTARSRQPDPVAELDGLRAECDALDAASGEARGLQRRIENARSAAVGALAQARSHIGVARDYMAGRRSVGSQARTRLAEAERQLALAEAESDPVERLDAARRASMHAIDADALARYDARP